VSYKSISGLEATAVQPVQERVKSTYLNCLEDCANFLRYEMSDMALVRRARASESFLRQKLI